MIDAVDAVADRQLDAVGRAGVRGDLLAELVRDLARHPDFVVHVGRAAGRRVRVEVVARDVELDVVDALADAGTDRAADFLRPVGDQREALAVQVELALVAETAGGDQLRAGGPHARPGNLARIDCVAHDHVEARLGRGGAVDAGEAALQQQLGVGRGLEGVLLGRDHAEVEWHRHAGEGGMAVALDHAGHQGHALSVDRRSQPVRARSGCGPCATARTRLPWTSTSPGNGSAPDASSTITSVSSTDPIPASLGACRAGAAEIID